MEQRLGDGDVEAAGIDERAAGCGPGAGEALQEGGAEAVGLSVPPLKLKVPKVSVRVLRDLVHAQCAAVQVVFAAAGGGVGRCACGPC